MSFYLKFFPNIKFNESFDQYIKYPKRTATPNTYPESVEEDPFELFSELLGFVELFGLLITEPH